MQNNKKNQADEGKIKQILVAAPSRGQPEVDLFSLAEVFTWDVVPDTTLSFTRAWGPAHGAPPWCCISAVTFMEVKAGTPNLKADTRTPGEATMI